MKPAQHALRPRCPDSGASLSLRRSTNYSFLRRSNFLTTRDRKDDQEASRAPHGALSRSRQYATWQAPAAQLARSRWDDLDRPAIAQLFWDGSKDGAMPSAATALRRGLGRGKQHALSGGQPHQTPAWLAPGGEHAFGVGATSIRSVCRRRCRGGVFRMRRIGRRHWVGTRPELAFEAIVESEATCRGTET